VDKVARDEPMNPRLLLQQLIAYEQRIHCWYQTLAVRAVMPAKARAFWRSMAEDHLQCLALLEQSERVLDLIESLPEVLRDVFLNVENPVATAEAALQRVDLSVEEALQHSVSIESSALNGLVRMWLQGFSTAAGSFLPDLEHEHQVRYRRLFETIETLSHDPQLYVQALAIWRPDHPHLKGRITVRLKS
jgi:hypothetical protein